jgi:hypothetical protein
LGLILRLFHDLMNADIDRAHSIAPQKNLRPWQSCAIISTRTICTGAGMAAPSRSRDALGV